MDDREEEQGALLYIMFLGAIYSAVVYCAGVSGHTKAACLLGAVGILILLVLWLLEKRNQLLR